MYFLVTHLCAASGISWLREGLLKHKWQGYMWQMHTYYTQINSLSFYCFAPLVWATYHIYGLFPKLCKHLHFFSVKVLVCSRGKTSKHCFFEANKIYFVCSAIQVNFWQQCVFSLKFWGNNLKFPELKIHFPPNTLMWFSMEGWIVLELFGF